MIKSERMEKELKTTKKYLQECLENKNLFPVIFFAMLFGFGGFQKEIEKEVDKNEP